MTVRDGRTVPFCHQTVPALDRLRDGYSAISPARRLPRFVVVLGLYQVLTEIANERRSRTAIGSDSEGFEATRAYIATKARVDKRTVDAALGVIEEVGLLRIARRRRGAAHLHSVYVLLDPPPSGHSSPPSGHSSPPSGHSSPPSGHSSPGVAEEDRHGGGLGSPGVADTVRPVQEEKEEKEENTAAAAADDPQVEEQVERVFACWAQETERQGAQATPKRRLAIRAALESHSPEQLEEAIGNWHLSPFHRGDNQRGKPFNDLRDLLRDVDVIEELRGLYPTAGGQPNPSPYDAAVVTSG